MTEASTQSAVIDFSTFDLDVRIQDDLFRHVNGTWLDTTEIPADKPLTGAFMELRDQAEAAVRDIITTLEGGEPGSDEGRIADLYASFMDEDAVERAGVSPILPLLAAIDSVETLPELTRMVGGFARQAVPGLVALQAEPDPGDPTRYVMFAGQGGLGLPDEEYYRLDEYAAIRAQYQAHVSASFALAGIENPEAQAQQVFNLETEIAATHWDKVKCRDIRLMYNLMSLDEFVTNSPGLHWREFLAGGDIAEEKMSELVAMQPSFFTEVSALLTADRLPAWRAWARWKVISSLSPYLSSAFVDENFRFYGTVLMGTPELRERWKRGVALVEVSVGEAVGKIYVDRYFSAVAKQRLDQLVANLIEAYRRSITDLDWMTAETKDSALAKLAKFRPHIGYPTKWRDYSSLVISRDNLIGNVMRVADFEVNRALNKIGQPIDREEWLMTPQTVNAYYHPLKNEIVFPAAILQPPFFNEHGDDAVNYGGIGAVIGHEIGHGFDDQGSTCDGDGALRNWWTDKDRQAFEARAKALIAQYEILEPAQAPGHRVNGQLTIGENIGDLGGLSIAYKAYQIAHETSPEPELDGYTPEQRLFISWAVVWQAKVRTEMLLQRLATDPHSPAEFRCNQIVRNLPEFYAAFDVRESDALWLDEKQRVKIW
ncbi:MAG TPA: M13-type metalloendopeptidase [Propionibacteriaceae bacterium]|nr:M13-type metalloendopeptidase [Propionibacteriaceae bacterium]